MDLVLRGFVPLRLLAPLVLMFASTAVAAPGEEGSNRQALEAEGRRLYQEALALAEAGRWSEARQRFRRVVEIRATPKALTALAYAELHLDNLLRARSLYTRARDDARAAGNEDDARNAADGIARVEQRIPRLILALPDDVSPHEVRVGVDRRSVPLRGGVVEVDPGDHELIVSAPGRLPYRTRVTAAPGARVDVRVLFPNDPGASPSGPKDTAIEADPASDGPSPIGPIVLGSAGLITTTVGALMWIGGNSDYQAVIDACGETGAKCPDSLDANEARANDAIEKIRNGQIVAGTGAALMVGAGIWWMLAQPDGVTAERAQRPLALRWDAGITSRGFAATLGGRF